MPGEACTKENIKQHWCATHHNCNKGQKASKPPCGVVSCSTESCCMSPTATSSLCLRHNSSLRSSTLEVHKPAGKIGVIVHLKWINCSEKGSNKIVHDTSCSVPNAGLPQSKPDKSQGSWERGSLHTREATYQMPNHAQHNSSELT